MKKPLARALFITLCVVLVGVGCVHASQAKAPSAFSTKRVKTDIPPNLQGRGVARIRPVVLNLKLFNADAAQSFLRKKREKAGFSQSTQMFFFPDADLTVESTGVERVGQPSGL